MVALKENNDPIFRNAVRDLEEGNFSRLEPLFRNLASSSHASCQIIEWYDLGYFKNEPKALNEALTCACFNGQAKVAKFLLDRGVDPLGGFGTGMNGFHWAANRGHLETVKLLIERKFPMEIENMYGGTVLGCTVWSAVHEPRANQIEVIEALLSAGAKIEAAEYPTGNARVDGVLRRHGAENSAQSTNPSA
jgi:ankyrin repeat protein